MSIVASSFLVGILIGLTSMGGAALMTPFLIVFAGLSTSVAVGTDLVYGSVTRMFGAAVHWRQGTVDLHIVKLLATGSVLFSFLGFLLGHNLYGFGIDSNKWLRHALGAVLLVVAVTILYRTDSRTLIEDLYGMDEIVAVGEEETGVSSDDIASEGYRLLAERGILGRNLL